MMDKDEFYIGYLAEAPAGHARLVRRVLAGVAAVMLVTVGLLAAAQDRGAGGQFEYGTVREFQGVLYTEPVPMLQLTATDGGLPPVGTTLLVGAWKYGIPEAARAANGKSVTFSGTLIYRDALTMIELTAPETLVVGETPDVAPPTQTPWVQHVELTGELVDTKCYLGVMRPGVGKVHRGCAVRCLSGGVPPAILLRGDDGRTRVFMLAGADGGDLDYDVQLAARTITVEGALWLVGGTPVVHVDSLVVHDEAAAPTEGQ